jgi:hypothetical protein
MGKTIVKIQDSPSRNLVIPDDITIKEVALLVALFNSKAVYPISFDPLGDMIVQLGIQRLFEEAKQ